MAGVLLAADAAKETKPAEKKAPALVQDQQQVTEKFQHLKEVLFRMGELTESTDPRRAALLKKAFKQSQDEKIDEKLKALVELLKKEQLSDAIKTQGDVDRDLRTLLELLLSENRSKRLESEKARIRAYIKQLNEIIRQQKDVQGRTAGGDDAKQLSGEQKALADKTGGLAKEMAAKEKGDASSSPSPSKEKGEGRGAKGEKKEEKDSGDSAKPKDDKKAGDQKQGGGNSLPPKDGKQSDGKGDGKSTPKDGKKSDGQGQGQGGDQKQTPPQDDQQNPAQKRLEAAQQRMKEAQKKLEEAQRKGATDKQEEAIRELQQAKAELEKILRQLREEEIARMLAMLEARFRQMLQMQREVYEGTLQLDKIPQADWNHNHEIESGRLSNKETAIVVEADKALMLLREDGSAVAFPESVGQMRDDMQQVVQRLAQAKVGKITQSIEEEIVAALEEMIEALKKAQKDQQDRKSQSGQPPPGQQQDPPLVDSLAELKMIRALQMRVNNRTQRYSKMIQGEQAESADLVVALQKLAEWQQRIYRVTHDLELGKNR